VRKNDVNDDAEFGEHETIEELLEIDSNERKELELIEAIAEGKCPDNILMYTQQQYEMRVPFTIYADFESFIGENDVRKWILYASDFEISGQRTLRL